MDVFGILFMLAAFFATIFAALLAMALVFL
jgi:hypothetical protein